MTLEVSGRIKMISCWFRVAQRHPNGGEIDAFRTVPRNSEFPGIPLRPGVTYHVRLRHQAHVNFTRHIGLPVIGGARPQYKAKEEIG